MKRIIIAGILIVLLLTGCLPSVSPPAPGGTAAGGRVPETGEITDPVQLEEIWQEYIYTTIFTLGNILDFDSAAEIRPDAVAQFCWYKYLDEHGPAGLKTVSEESALLLFPVETALEYVQRYFNLQSLDVSQVPDYYYNPEKQAFTLSNGHNEKNPSYTEKPFGINLDKVTKDDSGTVTVRLISYSSDQSQRIESKTTYTLKQREDGSLYFMSGRREYINNHLVAISGDVQCFEKIEGFTGNPQGLSMVGEMNGKAVLVYDPYDGTKKLSLMRMDPQTMTIEHEVELTGAYDYTHFKITGQTLIVTLKDKILICDHEFRKVDEIPLPQSIAQKMDRDPQYDRVMIPQVAFRGYDIAGDFSRIVYADETGVKLYDIKSESEKMLAETPPPLSSKEIDQLYHSRPRFVAADQKVITNVLAYEGIYSHTLYDLKAGSGKDIKISDENSTGQIYYDTGLLSVNLRVPADDQDREYQTLYLDFESGEVKTIELDRPGDAGAIRDHGYSYVGQNHAAFITMHRDRSDNTQSMYYISRVQLKTLEAEHDIIAVKASSPYLLGVLSDGRMIFWYDLNPSERGICLSEAGAL